MSPLSPRANDYLATLERVPAEKREDTIRAALNAAGLPDLPSVVEFQVRFGGLVTYHYLNRFEWGIVHAVPVDCSPFWPNEVDCFTEDDDHFVTCCNCHGSDHWYLNIQGGLHWCFRPPLVSSFQVLVEKDALCWTLARGTFRRIRFKSKDEEVLDKLLPRLADGLVVEASDQYESLYHNEGVYAAIKNGELIAATTIEGVPSILRDIDFTFE